MNEEEKNAIEYLKNRLYGNEDCKYIDVAQEDLRVFIKLIEKLQKENKYMHNELDKQQTKINKYAKENEELKIIKSAIQTLQINSIEDEKYIVISKSSFFDGSYKHLLDEFIPVQKVKDKIEKYKKLSDKFYVKFLESDRYNTDIREKGIKCDAIILALEELIEEREEK